MKDKERLALRRAASNYVRHQPGHFAEAAAWVASLTPMGGASKKPGSASAESVAYRTVEALVLHYRALVDQQPMPKVETKQHAYRVILTSWLLTEVAHEPFAKPGSLFDPADRHDGLQVLPVLDGREFMRLTVKYALDSDPRWHGVVLAAWKLVDDPGYINHSGDSELPKGTTARPKNAASLPRPTSRAVACARESYDWAREHAPHLFHASGRKYPESVFNFVTDPKNGCPAYAGKSPPLSYGSWERYVRLSLQRKPLSE